MTRFNAWGRNFPIGLAANALPWAFGLVSANAAGFGKSADTTQGDIVLGWAPAHVDNTGGGNGAASISVQTGTIKLDNDATHPVTAANNGRPVFVKDDHTVQNAAGGSSVVAGIQDRIDSDGGIWVTVAPEISNVVDGDNGSDDIILGTTAPSGTTAVTFVETTGTKTGVLSSGYFAGQQKRIVQSVAATTPIGTITGTFKTLAGAAATTLGLGTVVGTIADFIWDGAAWRQSSALGGTGSSLA